MTINTKEIWQTGSDKFSMEWGPRGILYISTIIPGNEPLKNNINPFCALIHPILVVSVIFTILVGIVLFLKFIKRKIVPKYLKIRYRYNLSFYKF